MRFLGPEETRAALPMADAIESQEVAFTEEWEAPLRSWLGSSLVMPGRVGDIMAVKVVSTVPGNPAGIVVVFDGDGSPLGLVDGPTLTAIRTGAGCGLATRVLSDPSASTLAMLGSGTMAFDQVQAVTAVRAINHILVWSRSVDNARRLAGRVGGEAVESADEAVSVAQIVSCATPSTEPLFDPESVGECVHINAVGAFKPEMVEIPADVLERAYVVVDDYAAAAAEAGDLIQADRTPNATLTELLAGSASQKGEDVTVFKSVGIASQDVAAAHRALLNAAVRGIGVVL